MKITDLKAHPLAQIFPPMQQAELEALAESIKLSGLREPIVLLDGQILDGLNRHRACQLAGAGEHFREFGSRETDGDSPTRFVADANLQHRFLSTSQRNVLAAEMLPFYEAEATTKADALKIVSAQFNSAPSSVRKAEALKKTDGTGFDQVKRGAKSLDAASKEAKAAAAATNAKTAQQAEELEAKELEPIREAHKKDVTKIMGEQFGVAFENGVILKTRKELDAFLALDKEDKKLVGPLVVQKWEVARALKFMRQNLTGEDRLKDLVLQCAGLNKPLKVWVNGWIVTARKAVDGESDPHSK